MNPREPEGLLARVRQLRRHAEQAADRATPPVAETERGALQALEARVTHLERLLQGFQDSVHRETSRQNRRIAELDARLQPGAMGKALDQDARERGL